MRQLLVGLYFAAMLFQVLVRSRIERQRRSQKKVDRRVTARERSSLGVLSVGLLLVPIVWTATRWLDLADYRLPAWAGAIGVAVMTCGLFLFWRAHADLGLNWSPSLELRERHELITRGIYGVLRHPMYTSLLLWALAQPLLLQNWIAGGLGLASFLVFTALRVGPEERMMLDAFGDEYRAYMQRVGGVLPTDQPLDVRDVRHRADTPSLPRSIGEASSTRSARSPSRCRWARASASSTRAASPGAGAASIAPSRSTSGPRRPCGGFDRGSSSPRRLAG